MKTTPFKSQWSALLAIVALPAGFASGQTALPAPSGVNLQSTGSITNAPAVTLPNSTSATPTAPAFSWEGSNLLQGYVLPVSNFTGRTTTGASVNYEDLLPLKATKIQVMKGAAGAAPTAVGTLIDSVGIDTDSVITDVLKVKDATTGTDVPISVNNGVLNVNGSSSGLAPQTLTLSGNSLTLSNGGGTVTLPSGAGTVTNITTGAGLTGGPITNSGTISLADSGAAAGTYGSGSAVPVVTVDAKGRVTAASSTPLSNLYNSDGTLSGGRNITMGANDLVLSGSTGDLIFASDLIKVYGGRSVEFGADIPTKEPNAGKVYYNASGDGTLDITGAGPPNVPRVVRILDSLQTGAISASSISVNGSPITGANIYTANGSLTEARSVFVGGYPLTFVGSVAGGVTLNLANVSNSNTAYTQFGILNDTSPLIFKLNSSTRTVDGGPNMATIQNLAGSLSLLNSDRTGISIYPSGVLNIEGFDLRLGSNNQVTQGNSGLSRALVKLQGPNNTSFLALNLNADYSAGTLIGGNTQIGGNIEVNGFDIVLGKTDNGTRGNSGASRALVKLAGSNNTSILGINFAGDYESGVVIGGNTTSISGSAVINGQAWIGSLLRVGTIVEISGHEIQVGKNNLTRGDSGASRALVKFDNNTLVANFAGDYTGGFRVDSKVTISGDASQTLSTLYVGAGTGGSDGTFGYLNSTGAVGTATGLQPFSIYGFNTIATGGEFRAYSDARIKEHVADLSSASSLQTLNHLPLRKYRYKDTLVHGNKVKSGVFAQDVEKVFPEAVDSTMEYIPNVYQKATVTKGKTLQIKTDLSKGDKVRLYDAKNNELVVQVTAVTSNNFTVDQKIETNEVFVYGKQVKDFRHVDYDRLTVLNISATQELAKRVVTQASELAMVKTEKSVLAEEVKTQKAEIASLKKQQAAEIAQIKAALEAMNKLVAMKVTDRAAKVVSSKAR